MSLHREPSSLINELKKYSDLSMLEIVNRKWISSRSSKESSMLHSPEDSKCIGQRWQHFLEVCAHLSHSRLSISLERLMTTQINIFAKITAREQLTCTFISKINELPKGLALWVELRGYAFVTLFSRSLHRTLLYYLANEFCPYASSLSFPAALVYSRSSAVS